MSTETHLSVSGPHTPVYTGATASGDTERSECGAARAKLALSERTYHCHCCGLSLDRDINAARNTLAAGLAESQNACGGRVRPLAPRRVRQRPVKQEPGG